MSIRSLLRGAKRWVEKKVGTASHQLYWLMRSRKWAERYLSTESIEHPHRGMLIEHLKKSEPFSSLLEIGCASGPNLYRIAKEFPDVKLFGRDINKKAISVAKKWFKEKNLSHIQWARRSVGDLKEFADNSIDIVLSDAVLLYVGPDKIKEVIAELVRVARKKLVFIERHIESSLHSYNDHWMHNFKELLRPYVHSFDQIVFTKIPENIWGGDWAENGYLIEITLDSH